MGLYVKLALGNVRRSLRDFSVFFLTLAFGVCVFYAFGSITEQTAVLDLAQDTRETVEDIMGILDGVSWLMLVVLGFLVVYANRFLIRRRKREFGVYLTLGMDARQVSLVIVVETLAVGTVALAVGLVLGVALSQAMMYATAAMFEVGVSGFVFVLSSAAALRTAACFAGVFALSLALNVREVNRYELIDLINAERVGERPTLRSLPVSVALFVASVAVLGVAYRTLVEYGMLTKGSEFLVATLLCVVGTLLLFYSVSGFLLRALQAAKGVYLRGLNMFMLRQLNSRINSAWLSISLVCAMLFVAICGVCCGLSIARGFNDALVEGCPYDACLVSYPTGWSYPERNTAAAEDGYDVVAALERDVEGFDELVEAYAQVDFRMSWAGAGGETGSGTATDAATGSATDAATGSDASASAPNIAWFAQNTDYTGSAIVNQALQSYESSASVSGGTSGEMPLVALSQVNALRALVGEEPLELLEGQCLLWSDIGLMDGFWRAALEQNPTLDVFGTELSFASTEPVTTKLCDSISSGTVSGALIVRDEDVPESARYSYSYLNVMYAGGREACDQAFRDAVDAAYGESLGTQDDGTFPWPVFSLTTAAELASETGGTTVTVTYLALYIGFVLLVSCASVLALQQLSQAADNMGRYRVLAELGAEARDIRRSLAAQIGVYFAFPLAVAVSHAAVALYVVSDVVALLTGYSIGNALAGSVAFVVALYGGYFLVTYATSKSMLLRNGVRS